ncbi:MAG: 3-methyl-2-oxobutanoate hydroxymethyltransferase [Acidobacteria bacterium]|nr:3-methyl-2-oxobutanoate hydroxymethyltransferase [Acidobacteriota bacterium]
MKMTVPGIGAVPHKLTMLTAYDYTMACLVDRSGAEMILVGDSLGMVVQGRKNTLGVSMDEMVYHSKAVVRGAQSALVVGDMPYLSYHVSPEETIRNAGRFVAEAGCDAVKLEGGIARLPMIRSLIQAEIPVMGHLGLTPQSVNVMGGFKLQGKAPEQRQQILESALALQEAGVFALVLECVPFDLAQEITESIHIPTIGIGAGPFCSGQVLVSYDLLGMSLGPLPKFVPTDLPGASIPEKLQGFVQSVRSGQFPSEKEAYGVNDTNRHLFHAAASGYLSQVSEG